MSKKEQDELDFSSANFNPSKALKNPDKVKLPYPLATTYDNLSCFIETPDGIFPKPKREPKQTKPKAPPPEAGTSKDEPEMKKEDIEEHLKKCKNVISRMERAEGPLAFIKKCMDDKSRVKVYTRGAVQIRGFCIGFIIAFDKHLNLVLKDVFETWTRKRKRKTPFLAPVPAEESEQCDSSAKKIQPSGERYNRSKINVKKPKIIVRQRLKRREICERHIHQILIRGEQIVIVTTDTNTNDQIFKNQI